MIEKIDEDFFLVEKLNEIIEAVNELSLRNDYSDADKQDTSTDDLHNDFGRTMCNVINKNYGQKPIKTFNFSEALKRMKDGKLFKRTSWTNAAKIYLENGKFKIRFEGNLGGDPYLFLYNHSDILANDWVEC